jgi:anti-sigma factor (TIGR02949 family)
VTCDEVLGKLDEYLDRNLSTEEVRQVNDHLTACLGCLEKYRFEHALLAGIRSRLRRISLPPHLLASIRLRLDSATSG